ncbi:hypothetical protein F183_A50530 [Bryobacterales bacterium F-183]|nr:hypothetical protein F183_A50530 [Bryobacterales bacterium F-183]
MRAWKAGRSLVPRIYGWFDDEESRSGVTLRLRESRDDERATRPDSAGFFSFDNLTPGEYRLVIEDARGRGETSIDLTRWHCYEASPWFSKRWYVPGVPVAIPIR